MEEGESRVAVIGGGVCGIVAVKSCLEEGLSVVGFEKCEDLGGLWLYTDEVIEDRSCVMRSTIINSSKEMSCFSDFPFPSQYHNYCHNSMFLSYLQLYSQHFNVKQHYKLNTRVTQMREIMDERSGRSVWEISYISTSPHLNNSTSNHPLTTLQPTPQSRTQSNDTINNNSLKQSALTNNGVSHVEHRSHVSAISDRCVDGVHVVGESMDERCVDGVVGESMDERLDGGVVGESMDERLGGGVVVERFESVMVCNGHHTERCTVRFEGEEKFKGRIIHSHEYRRPIGYENKRVVVVGLGNSGGDIATELSKVSKQVYLVVRRGAWIVHRVWDHGLPLDLTRTRFNFLLHRLIPSRWRQAWYEHKLNVWFDQRLYGVRPQHGIGVRHPCVNDDLPNRILSGEVIITTTIRRLHDTSVELDDGTLLEDIDVIICATGYTFSFPFTNHAAFNMKPGHVDLYKNVFSPLVSRPESLAVIGLIQPNGAHLLPNELQARWAVRVFKGLCTLPSRDSMLSIIRSDHAYISRRYPIRTQQSFLNIDFPVYVEELARMIGCNPNIWRILVTDPRLFYHVMFGPFTPFQFRLEGPGRWGGARQAVITVMDRVREPFRGSAPSELHKRGVVRKCAVLLLHVVLQYNTVCLCSV